MPFTFEPFIEVSGVFFQASLVSVILLLQFILGVALPGQSHRPPFVWWFAGRMGQILKGKLDRPGRGERSLFIRGILALVFMTMVAWGLATLGRAAALTLPYGWCVIVILVWGSINLTVPWRLLRGLAAVPDLNKLPQNTAALSDLTNMDFSKADAHTIARGALMYTAWALCRYMVAPVMAYILFGSMGLMIYVFAFSPVCDIDFGARPRQRFLRPFYLVQSIFDFIPARITAAVIYIAAILTPTAHPAYCLNVVFDGAQKFPGVNFGTVLKAFSGAVNVSLGGGVLYRDGLRLVYPWFGPAEASAKADVTDIKRGFGIHIYSFALVFLGVLICLI